MKLNLVGIDGKMDSQYYVDVLGSSSLPSADDMFGGDWIFQKDNAAVHSSNLIKSFLEANGIEVLDCPAKPLDLNTIENLWGQLVRCVYASGRQCYSVVELQDAIMNTWNSIDLHYIQSSHHSIPSRLISDFF